MKKALLSLAVILSGAATSMAYNTVPVSGSITANTHWTNNQQYLLQGYVYVESGATLTIDSGCIIKGDKASKGSLIIERGAKIIAIGSPTAPIVFTSNQGAGQRTYGDWGGVILCGKAPTNWTSEPTVEGGPRSKYGGTDPHDNSGTMQFVRIEFPGIAFSPNNEINGLTFCGVGDATQIDHIQVSYSGDDSYEWFGGTVNGKYLIAHRGWDDDFDTDNGYTGNNQFCVGVRDPFVADQSGSKGFESDSYQPGGVTNSGLAGDTSKITKPVFSNVTLVGPLVSPTSTAYDPQFTAAVHIRRGSAISILNSILFGYPAGVLFDESASTLGGTTANIANGILQFRNNIIAGIPTTSTNAQGGSKDIVYVKDGARSITPTNTNADTATNTPFAPFAGPFSYLTASANSNKTYANEQNGVRLQNPFNLTNPDFHPTSTSPVAYNTKGNGSATGGNFNPANPINYDTSNGYANYNAPIFAPNFTTTKASDAFFTKVNYVGAFSGVITDNWSAGWANYDPVNTDYVTYSNTNHYIPPTHVAITNISNTLQNARVFPNPASNTASVMFELNQSSNVTINMTDITGKIVKTVYNGDETKGIHTVSTDINSVSNGFYFMQITTSTGTRAVKFSIAK